MEQVVGRRECEREFHRTIAITRARFSVGFATITRARTCPLNYTSRSEPASYPNPSIARLALHFRLDYSPRHQSPRQSHKHPKPDSPVTINLESFLARVTAGFRESVSPPAPRFRLLIQIHRGESERNLARGEAISSTN